VSGTITATAGVILDGGTVAIQDGTAGIYVRLTDPALPGLVLGAVVDVVGAIAAPYGNLELRPATGAIRVIGSASVPPPAAMTMSQLGDSTEGLLVRVNVTVTSIDVSSTGAVTLGVEDATGAARVYFFAPLGVGRSDYAVGETLRVTGLAGDRLSLFRVWPRSRDDVVVTAPAPTPTPRPTATPRPTETPRPTSTPRPTATPTPRPTPTRPSSPTPQPTSSPHPTATPRPSATPGAAVTIAQALGRQGQAVTVEGVVTTRPGLLDSSSERVTIQDGSAAVLLRLPSGASVSVGQRVRASGTMGTYYGAPQLTATILAAIGTGTVAPLRVSSAPVPPSLEWQLVTLTGTVDSVQRDGASWRADLKVGSGSIPIVGIDRSGIASTALSEGRIATVVGIVKRAYPTSTDQRLAIVPRSAADISLGGAVASGSPHPSGSPRPATTGTLPTVRPANGATGSAGNPVDPGQSNVPTSASSGAATFSVISALGEHIGEIVRIGGHVVGIADQLVTIDDATGQVAVRLVADAAALADQLHVGDLINVSGTVTQSADGALEIEVADASSLARIPAPASLAAAESSAAASLDPAGVESDPTRRPGAGPSPLLAIAALLGLAGASLAAFAAAGPERRARLVATFNAWRTAVHRG
jgi:hypothetical protein